MKKIIFFLLVVLFFQVIPTALFAGEIITLTWDEVVEITRTNNLDLQMMKQDYSHQKLNEWKAVADFLPSINYQFQATNNIELPEFVFMGNRFRVGTEYNFSHSIQLQLPLFTGGLRVANWRIQRNTRKSLAEMLKDKEEEVVLQALEGYFQIMLANDLIRVNQQAVDAARANFEQVEKFYQAGSASQLDYLRAKSRLSSTLPQLTSAFNAKKMAVENLKFVLNIDPSDSLIILDTLRQMDFLGEYSQLSLKNLKELALSERSDLKGAYYQKQTAKNQKLIAGSRFLPQVVLNAGVQHQAQVEDIHVGRDDYTRSKFATVALQFSLFQGSKRILEYQQARIVDKKAEIQLAQLQKAVLLEVENSYHAFQEAKENISSLLQANREAREALRLANLTYREGLSTQVDVLNAQLAFTNSQVLFRKGIFNYNVSQLKLLKAIGKKK